VRIKHKRRLNRRTSKDDVNWAPLSSGGDLKFSSCVRKCRLRFSRRRNEREGSIYRPEIRNGLFQDQDGTDLTYALRVFMMTDVAAVSASLNRWTLTLMRALAVINFNDDEVSKLPSIGLFVVSTSAFTACRDYPNCSAKSDPSKVR
jgi:hypothetical protein